MTDETYFAAVGDVHGAHHLMVERLTQWKAASGRRLSFVLQVGDFEPNRCPSDLETTTGPVKFRKLGDFPDFVEGRARFPWQIYAIGGNHEPYGWLDGMPQGGELAPNCAYLGRAGCVDLGGLRVASGASVHRLSTSFR